jgi:penicillin-binding protein 2
MALTVNRPAAAKDLRLHALIMAGCCVLGGFVLIWRLKVVQLDRGDEFVAKSTENYIKETRIPADRGQILDRKERLLVDNRASYDVWLTPAFCGHACIQEVLPRLGMYLSLTNEDKARITALFKSATRLERFRDFPVKIDITPDERAVMEFHAATDKDLPGIEVKERPHRTYIQSTLLAHAT